LPAQLEDDLAALDRERDREVERGRLDPQRIDTDETAVAIDGDRRVDAARAGHEGGAGDAQDEAGEASDQPGGCAAHGAS
jgi:hypothetical protein